MGLRRMARIAGRRTRALACLLMSTGHCLAQASSAPEATLPKPYTLHVYENLVQVPTLVLDRSRGIEGAWRTQDFRVSLDAGPPFIPAHMRREGEDALAVAVVLDASGGVATQVLTELTQVLNANAGGLFSAEDRVQLFALGCNLLAGRVLQPGSSTTGTDRIARSAEALFAAPTLQHREKNGTVCMPHRLWDTLTIAAGEITKVPGRRVVLFLTDGEDRGSRFNWNTVAEHVGGGGVTVFPLRWGNRHNSVALKMRSDHGGRTRTLHEDPLDLLANETGGVVTQVSQGELLGEVKEVLTMIRSRYVLEFGRPANAAEGMHQIVVTVPDAQALVFAAGVTVGLESAAVRDDPNRVPNDLTHAPIVGERHSLPHRQ